jgi:hypothetical protein
MRSKVNEENMGQTKPAVVYECNLNMGATDPKNQMLQTYLLQQNKGSEWYMKLFKRLLNKTIHNCMINWSTPNNRK